MRAMIRNEKGGTSSTRRRRGRNLHTVNLRRILPQTDAMNLFHLLELEVVFRILLFFKIVRQSSADASSTLPCFALDGRW